MKKLLEERMKSIKFLYHEKESNIKYKEFYFNDNNNLVLEKIESSNYELSYEGQTYGRILFDINTDKVYYIDGLLGKIINIYENYENFKLKKKRNLLYYLLIYKELIQYYIKVIFISLNIKMEILII